MFVQSRSRVRFCGEGKAPLNSLTQRVERCLLGYPLLASVQAFYYRFLVGREIASAAITSSDRVLCVGGGPFPFSAIEIARRTGARVVVIDSDAQAVLDARQVVADLGLVRLVEVRLADGRNYSAAGFQVVHIARQASPQQDIVDNLVATGGDGLRIVRRRVFW